MQPIPRLALLEILNAALGAVDGRSAVARWLGHHPIEGPISLLAIGKAAEAMALGAFDALPGGIRSGLVISKPGHLDPRRLAARGIKALAGGHPLPTAESLIAGERLLVFLRQQSAENHLLFLLSGGASSLAEVLRPGLELRDLQRANQWLLSSGLDIAAMNAVRRGLSRIKGGGLLPRIEGREATLLCISDVQGDDPAVIGSGPLTAPPNTPLPEGLPDWLSALLAAKHGTPQSRAPIRTAVVANQRMALDAAAQAAGALGLPTWVHPEFLSGPAEATGRRLAAALRAGPAGVHLWGGETTVTLPPEPGRGGRNQHLALAAAQALAGCNEFLLLATGTDGADGPGKDAGALVDGRTIERGETQGLDSAVCLQQADSGRFLEASGDLIHTGPTGTNVMDLVIGVKPGADPPN